MSISYPIGDWWQRVVHRRRPVSAPLWQGVCRHLTLLSRYTPAELQRLRALTGRFLRQKDIQGAAGLEVNEAMRVLVAVQACVPILNLGLQWYRGWVSVLMYPDEFLVREEYADEAGVVHLGADTRIGESWSHGPVILSWRHAKEHALRGEWGNVVIHEFAHKLDLLNGAANGMPPLHKDMSRSVWARAFALAYEDFCERVDAGEALPFDDYAAEAPGEFFAVISEAFFLQPRSLLWFYPDVYAQLALFYRQDLAQRDG